MPLNENMKIRGKQITLDFVLSSGLEIDKVFYLRELCNQYFQRGEPLKELLPQMEKLVASLKKELGQ